MMEVMQLLLELSSAIKEIKAQLLVLKQTRTEKFKQSWIDGQDVMLALKISKRTLTILAGYGDSPLFPNQWQILLQSCRPRKAPGKQLFPKP